MHILIAVDGSNGAKQALETVANTPFPPGTRATLLHVISRYIPAEPPLPVNLFNALQQDEDNRAKRVLKEAHQALADSHLALEVRHEEGHPAERIVEVAQEIGADLIVMGALGLTGWIRMLLGSISLSVVKHTHCPVWVIKRPLKLRRMDVLVTTDGSENALHALHFLCEMPMPDGAICHLLHVTPTLNQQLHLTGSTLDPPILAPLYKLGEHHKQHGELLLKEGADCLVNNFAEVRPFTTEGDPRQQILEAATEVEADLIVMGTKGLSGIAEFFLGSISHKVLKHAKASVLVVPDPAP